MVQWGNPLRKSHSGLVSCSGYGCSYPTQHWDEVSTCHFSSSVSFPAWEKEILVHELAGSSQKIRQTLLWRCSENMTCKVYWKTICPIMKEWPSLPTHTASCHFNEAFYFPLGWGDSEHPELIQAQDIIIPSSLDLFPACEVELLKISWIINLSFCVMWKYKCQICFIFIVVVHRVRSLNCSEHYNIIFLRQKYICTDNKSNRAWKTWDVMWGIRLENSFQGFYKPCAFAGALEFDLNLDWLPLRSWIDHQ